MLSQRESTPTLMGSRLWDGALYLNGWRKSSNSSDVTDKATGAVLAQTVNGSLQDIAEACSLATMGAPSWARTPVEQRAAIVRRAGELLDEFKEEAIYWLVRESGSTRYKAEFEVAMAKAHFFNSADMSLKAGRTVLTDSSDSYSYFERGPLGVVGIIGPFNFPLILGVRSVTAALATGNTVVLKPSLNTAISGGILIARLFELAGLPRSALYVIPGEGAIGAALAENPLVTMIAFTGSTAVGRRIGATAGAALKRVSLELGGKNPLVVLKEADLELVTRAGAFGTFLHQGQICMSTGLHLVPHDMMHEYSERLALLARDMKVGDPFTDKVALGPIINAKQRDAIHQIVRDSVAAGARLVEGGTFDGLFYRPTVLTDVPRTSRAFREEIFGPVAVVVGYRDEEDAIQMANSTGYGLSAAVFGEINHARSVANRIESGMVHINDQTVMEDARAPFGGIRLSGNPTRIGGPADLEEYTTIRWVTETRTPMPYQLPNR